MEEINRLSLEFKFRRLKKQTRIYVRKDTKIYKIY